MIAIVNTTDLFGYHVHKSTLVHSFIGLIFSALMIVVFSFTHKNGQYFEVTLCVLALITYLLVLLGNRLEKRFLYIPFFIITPLTAIAQICMSIYLSILGGVLIKMDINKVKEDDELQRYYNMVIKNESTGNEEFVRSLGFIFVIIGVGFFVAFVVQVYFYYILVLAYDYLKKL